MKASYAIPLALSVPGLIVLAIIAVSFGSVTFERYQSYRLTRPPGRGEWLMVNAAMMWRAVLDLIRGRI